MNGFEIPMELFERIHVEGAPMADVSSGSTGVTASIVIERIKLIADRRNQIAHAADRDPTNPAEKQPITADEVQEHLDWLETGVQAIVTALDTADGAFPVAQHSPESPANLPGPLTEDERARRFDELLREHQAEAEAVWDILKRWVEIGGWLCYGKGQETSCLPILWGEGSTWYWALAIYPIYGRIEVVFQHLNSDSRPPFNDLALRRELRDRINRIPRVNFAGKRRHAWIRLADHSHSRSHVCPRSRTAR